MATFGSGIPFSTVKYGQVVMGHVVQNVAGPTQQRPWGANNDGYTVSKGTKASLALQTPPDPPSWVPFPSYSQGLGPIPFLFIGTGL